MHHPKRRIFTEMPRTKTMTMMMITISTTTTTMQFCEFSLWFMGEFNILRIYDTFLSHTIGLFFISVTIQWLWLMKHLVDLTPLLIHRINNNRHRHHLTWSPLTSPLTSQLQCHHLRRHQLMLSLLTSQLVHHLRQLMHRQLMHLQFMHLQIITTPILRQQPVIRILHRLHKW